MKRCPVCNTIFDNPYLSFCPNDGTPLLRMRPDEAHTVLLSARDTNTGTGTGPAPAPNLPTTPQPYGWANDAPQPWVAPPPPSIPGPANQQQSLAVASLILGLIGITFGWLCGGPFFAILAVVLGIVALLQIKKDPLRHGGKPLALTGLILGALTLVIYVGLMALWAILFAAGAVSG